MPKKLPQSPAEEAIDVSSAILADFAKGGSITRIARRCAHLGNILEDEYLIAYVEKCLGWSAEGTRGAIEEAQKTGAHQRLEAIVDCASDFQTSAGRGRPAFLTRNLPDAENFVSRNRNNSGSSPNFRLIPQNVEQAQAVLERVSNRLHQRVSTTYLRLRFGNIPESIFASTQAQVDIALASICPTALEKFTNAYENLARGNSDSWSSAALAMRRVLTDLADALYPAREGMVGGHSVGSADYMNRLWAYMEEKISSKSTRTTVDAELTDLGNRLDSIHKQSNKGVHAEVSKNEANRIVMRTYLLIADLLDT